MMDDPLLIPTLSLLEDHDVLVQAVRTACTTTGFFYVAHHGVDTVDALFQQSQLFFSLPTVEKQALFDPTLARGYTGMGEETLDTTTTQSRGDTKEAFYASHNDIPVHDPRYNPSQLLGPNQWPDPHTCPSLKDPATFHSVVTQYRNAILPVAHRIVQLIAESLELPPDHFDAAFRETPQALLGLLHYAPVPSNAQRGVFGCGEHSDYGMITLLQTDACPGLQIYYQDQWVNVPPRPDCFVCNLGDMLERWTNGKYASTVHRVLNTTGQERYSMPFFYEPSFDTVVECLPTCCSDENPPLYPPITSGEHLVAKYKETHADFTPSSSGDA